MRRPRQSADHRLRRVDLVLPLVIAALALALRWWQLSELRPLAGEAAHLAGARAYVENLRAGGAAADRWRVGHPFPPLTNWLYAPATAAVAQEATAEGEGLAGPRAVSAVIGALTCALLFVAGRDLLGRWVGSIGALVCAVMPQVVAHQRLVGVEAPSALFYLLTVWLFFRGLRRGGNSGWYALAGLCAGLALAVRLANASVLLVLPAMYLVAEGPAIRRERRVALPLSMLLTPLLALGVLVAVWPYLWRSPGQWATAIAALPPAGPPVGPRPALLAFVVTMPALALAALALALGPLLRRRTVGQLCLLLWFLGPFLVALLPVTRGGVRDLFPALIPACLLVALGADAVARLAAQFIRPRLHLQLSTLVAAVLAIYLLHAGLSVHPDYGAYRGALAGWISARGASRSPADGSARPSTLPASRPSTLPASRPSTSPSDAL